MSKFIFPYRNPVASSLLPLTLISLEDLSLVTVYGADSSGYLQSQVTIDITTLNINQHLLCAHCNAKGKTWSVLRLFRRREGYAYLIRRSVQDLQINELKKYSVFSKVTIIPDKKSILLGLTGSQARKELINHFSTLPDVQRQVVHNNESTILWFNVPSERFLLITHIKKAIEIKEAFENKAEFNNNQQWLALDIEAGLPIIDKETSAQFIPQAINLQVLDAISFRKGCYVGQEMIARAKFRGANKRSLYWLTGKANFLPDIGDALEIKVREHWRSTGSVLASVRLKTGDVWIQAVLNNNLDFSIELRLKNDENSKLKIRPLPYSLID